MKTTYPPQKTSINEWYEYVYTARDTEGSLEYAKLERQLVALQNKLQNCTIKQYYPLKGKIEQLKKQIQKSRQNAAWNNYLAK